MKGELMDSSHRLGPSQQKKETMSSGHHGHKADYGHEYAKKVTILIATR